MATSGPHQTPDRRGVLAERDPWCGQRLLRRGALVHCAARSIDERARAGGRLGRRWRLGRVAHPVTYMTLERGTPQVRGATKPVAHGRRGARTGKGGVQARRPRTKRQLAKDVPCRGQSKRDRQPRTRARTCARDVGERRAVRRHELDGRLAKAPDRPGCDYPGAVLPFRSRRPSLCFVWRNTHE